MSRLPFVRFQQCRALSFLYPPMIVWMAEVFVTFLGFDTTNIILSRWRKLLVPSNCDSWLLFLHLCREVQIVDYGANKPAVLVQEHFHKWHWTCLWSQPSSGNLHAGQGSWYGLGFLLLALQVPLPRQGDPLNIYMARCRIPGQTSNHIWEELKKKKKVLHKVYTGKCTS